MFESRTIEITDLGRAELRRTPGDGMSARIEVRDAALISYVDPDGRLGVTVELDGKVIWQYEMNVTPRERGRDVNEELREQAEDVLVPQARRRGRPPKPPVQMPRRNVQPTLAELAAQQERQAR